MSVMKVVSAVITRVGKDVKEMGKGVQDLGKGAVDKAEKVPKGIKDLFKK